MYLESLLINLCSLFLKLCWFITFVTSSFRKRVAATLQNERQTRRLFPAFFWRYTLEAGYRRFLSTELLLRVYSMEPKVSHINMDGPPHHLHWNPGFKERVDGFATSVEVYVASTVFKCVMERLDGSHQVIRCSPWGTSSGYSRYICGLAMVSFCNNESSVTRNSPVASFDCGTLQPILPPHGWAIHHPVRLG